MDNKRYLLVIFVSFFAAILQTSVFYEFFGHYLNPDLLIALVLGFMLNAGYQSAYLSAIFGGVLLDFLNAKTPGLSAFIISLYVWVYFQVRGFYLHGVAATAMFWVVLIYLYRIVISGSLFFNVKVLISCLLSVAIGYTIAYFMKRGYEKVNL